MRRSQAVESSGENGEVVDWDVALQQVEGRQSLLRDLAKLFIQEGPRLLSDAEQAAAAKDVKALRIAAHTLKGSLRYFGPTESHSLASQLEQHAREGNLEQTPELLTQLRGPMDSLCVCLLEYVRRCDPQAP